MTSRNVLARSILPALRHRLPGHAGQSSEIRLPTIWRPETLSSVANCLEVMPLLRLRCFCGAATVSAMSSVLVEPDRVNALISRAVAIARRPSVLPLR
jgi:hypothetical protein